MGQGFGLDPISHQCLMYGYWIPVEELKHKTSLVLKSRVGVTFVLLKLLDAWCNMKF